MTKEIVQTGDTLFEKATWAMLGLSTLAFLAIGCAPTNVRTDAMSAQSHRQEAAKERATADSQRKLFNPHATARTAPLIPPAALDTVVLADTGGTYNPTRWHLTEAARSSAHARQHEAAAAKLESFEAAECAAIAPNVRAACPVLGPVSRVEDLANGVRVYLTDGAPIDAIIGHMRCHTAYARARHFEQVADCPLYIKGVDIQRTADGRAIEITGDRAGAGEIQRLARERVYAGNTL